MLSKAERKALMDLIEDYNAKERQVRFKRTDTEIGQKAKAAAIVVADQAYVKLCDHVMREIS